MFHLAGIVLKQLCVRFSRLFAFADNREGGWFISFFFPLSTGICIITNCNFSSFLFLNSCLRIYFFFLSCFFICVPCSLLCLSIFALKLLSRCSRLLLVLVYIVQGSETLLILVCIMSL